MAPFLDSFRAGRFGRVAIFGRALLEILPEMVVISHPAVAVLQVRIHEQLMDLQDGREIEGVLDRLEPVPLKRRSLTSVCSKKEMWRRLSESVTTHPTTGSY